MTDFFARNTDWHKPEYLWRRTVNENFNRQWIERHGLKFDEKVSLEELSAQGLNVADSCSFQVVWLKNIDRLMDMVPAWFDPCQYQLLDAGCGTGISTLYFAETYPFRHISGFDFSKDLISRAQTNLDQFARHYNGQQSVTFHVADARSYKLGDDPCFVFMFNPFGFETAKQFIQNNVEKLKRDNCVLAISNDVWAEQVHSLQLHKDIVRDSFNNLTLMFW